MKIALIAALAVAVAPAAFGKGKHHCMSSDGSEISSAQTKKMCKKAGGKWKAMKAGDMSAPPSSSSTPK